MWPQRGLIHARTLQTLDLARTLWVWKSGSLHMDCRWSKWSHNPLCPQVVWAWQTIWPKPALPFVICSLSVISQGFLRGPEGIGGPVPEIPGSWEWLKTVPVLPFSSDPSPTTKGASWPRPVALGLITPSPFLLHHLSPQVPGLPPTHIFFEIRFYEERQMCTVAGGGTCLSTKRIEVKRSKLIKEKKYFY